MVMIPPTICNMAGTSANRNTANNAATGGSQSFEADTNDGDKYFRHQLKILCPSSVEHTESSSPTTTEAVPYPVNAVPLTTTVVHSARAQNIYTT